MIVTQDNKPNLPPNLNGSLLTPGSSPLFAALFRVFFVLLISLIFRTDFAFLGTAGNWKTREDVRFPVKSASFGSYLRSNLRLLGPVLAQIPHGQRYTSVRSGLCTTSPALTVASRRVFRSILGLFWVYFGSGFRLKIGPICN